MVTVGWWPGDAREPQAAFYAFTSPAPPSFAEGTLSPAAAHWDQRQGEYILDWDDVRAAPDPRATAVEFGRTAFQYACQVSGWDPGAAWQHRGQSTP